MAQQSSGTATAAKVYRNPGHYAHMMAVPSDLRDPYRLDRSVTK